MITGKRYCQANLVLMNIINSSLVDWFDDFKHFRLCEYDAIKKIGVLGIFCINYE